MKVKSLPALLVMLAMTLSALGADEWKEVDEHFLLTIPSNWKRDKGQPIDSNAGGYKGQNTELEFDEVGGFMYPKGKSESAIADLKKKEADPSLLKSGEEIWRVAGRLADFTNGRVDPELYGKRRFTNVAGLFIPYKNGEGYLSIWILYRSDKDLPVVKRVLRRVRWKEKDN